MWPTSSDGSAVSYSLVVDGRQFDSFVPAGGDAPVTWDTAGSTYLDDASTWDQEAGTVTLRIPRDHLADAGIEAPYEVQSQSSLGSGEAQTIQNLLSVATLIDDRAPDPSQPLAVTAPGATTASVTTSLTGRLADTRTESGTFYTEQSTFGATGGGDAFTVDVPTRSDVAITLEWADTTGESDLDLFVTGAREASSASLDNPEQVTLTDVTGTLDVRVDPYFVADPVFGAEYTLTIEVVPLDGGADDGTGDPGTDGDRDGDGVVDDADACPDHPGVATNGCPATGEVRLVHDGATLATQAVSTLDGPDTFDLVGQVASDATSVEVQWLEGGEVVATDTVTIESAPGGDDGGTDRRANDTDGDGHSDGKERAHGTDPQDLDDYPTPGRHG